MVLICLPWAISLKTLWFTKSLVEFHIYRGSRPFPTPELTLHQWTQESWGCGHRCRHGYGGNLRELEADAGGKWTLSVAHARVAWLGLLRQPLLGESPVGGPVHRRWGWDWAPGDWAPHAAWVGDWEVTSQSFWFVWFYCPWRREVAKSWCLGGSRQAGSRLVAAWESLQQHALLDGISWHPRETPLPAWTGLKVTLGTRDKGLGLIWV